jgi:protoheme IX farnesyltransferase
MLPVVKGDRETRRQILLYAVVLLPVSLSLGLTREVGPAYLAIAGVAGLLFLEKCWALWRGYTPRRASNVFRFSIVYLTVVFAALIVDVAANAAFSRF